MIGRILAANKSYRSSLDYSERKYNEGLATVVSVHGMKNDSAVTFHLTFSDYEKNPAIAEKAYRIGFHMAISPDVTDPIYGDSGKHAALVDEVMERLGYGAQPYVVYRHNDIEREHFHVVSVRVDEKGRVISDSYENRKLMRILEELGPKYGFVLGKSEEKKKAEAKRGKLLPADQNKADEIRGRFTQALKFNFRNFSEFRGVMAAYGVYVKEWSRDGKRSLWFAACEDGKAASKMFSAEGDLKMKAYERYSRRLEENTGTERKVEGAETRAKRLAVAEYAAGKAGTWNEFAKMCSECDIEFVPRRRAGHLVDYTLVDLKRHTVGRAALYAEELEAKGWEQGSEVTDQLLSQADLLAILARINELAGKKPKEETKKKKERKAPAMHGGGAR